MCIAVLSTAHPDYSLILINNRDEYLSRPTARAHFWPTPHTHVLGGRDLLRAARGTWLGVTLDGRLACLTNYREPDQHAARGAISRGEMVNAYLTPPPSATRDLDAFVAGLVKGDGARGSGGFSMICGRLDEGRLAVVSNRSEEAAWVEGRGATVGLSNVVFGDRSWVKVREGERLMGEVLREAVGEGWGRERLVEGLFGVLSTDTLPPRREGEGWEETVKELRNSIFIPVVGDVESPGERQRSSVADAKLERVKSVEKGVSGAYATERQTVILVDHEGNVTFVEKALFDDDTVPIEENDRIRQFEFKIEKQGT